jgi:hypothetical protein
MLKKLDIFTRKSLFYNFNYTKIFIYFKTEDNLQNTDDMRKGSITAHKVKGLL